MISSPRIPALLALVLFTAPLPARAQWQAPEATIAAAKKGDAAAQYRLGEMYDLGRGVNQDYAQAVKWYRAAAEQGHAPAQFALAEMYKNGDGVPKDIAEAVRWYRRAADQGESRAQLLLGVLYESGVGVPMDAGQAADWYRRSAEQGDARAQMLLANLYAVGQGVPRNAVAAYALYTVSAATEPKGNPSLAHRDRLAPSMSAAEVESARGLTAEMTKPGALPSALSRALAEARR
jgi:TPR repeat protein